MNNRHHQNKFPKKKKSEFSQCLINENEQSFIIAKQFNKYTSIITPFKKNDNGEYTSGFFVPSNRAHRIQSLYKLMPKIASYSVYDEYISFDCLSRLPNDVFKNAESGIIHFFMQNTSFYDENENEIIDVDVRLVLPICLSDSVMMYKNESNIMFRADNMKVFPVVLSKGFILAVATPQKHFLYVTSLNPSKGYIGTCMRKELVNITQNIFPIWPIFNLIADENMNKLFLKKEIIDEIKPIIGQYNKVGLTVEYEPENTSEMCLQIFGSL